MKTKGELLYSNLLVQLEKILDDSVLDDYYIKLATPESKEKLLNYSEVLSKEKNIINNHFSNSTIYDGYDFILNQLDIFNKDFHDYPNLNYKELIIYIAISKRIVLSITDLDSTSIDEDVYECIPFKDDYLKQNAYFYLGSSTNKTLFLFNLSQPEVIDSLLEKMPIEYLFQILNHFCGAVSKPLGKYLIIDKTNLSHLKDITHILYTQMISDGEVLFNTPEYGKNPINNYRDKLLVGNKYQQFSDIINILSEYNNQKDIFDKYLRLYQIIENFMYRFPIVRLENNQPGRIFGIRDFKAMYQKVSKTEAEALSSLMNEVYKLPLSSGKNYKTYLYDFWRTLANKPRFNKTELNKFFNRLGLTSLDFDSVKQNNILNIYPNLIYVIRNSIVHNKETEFHLTYKTLTIDAQILIEFFLMPTIEETVFNLISSKNEIVWYKSSKLNLY